MVVFLSCYSHLEIQVMPAFAIYYAEFSTFLDGSLIDSFIFIHVFNKSTQGLHKLENVGHENLENACHNISLNVCKMHLKISPCFNSLTSHRCLYLILFYFKLYILTI